MSLKKNMQAEENLGRWEEKPCGWPAWTSPALFYSVIMAMALIDIPFANLNIVKNMQTKEFHQYQPVKVAKPHQPWAPGS